MGQAACRPLNTAAGGEATANVPARGGMHIQLSQIKTSHCMPCAASRQHGSDRLQLLRRRRQPHLAC